MRRWVGLGAGVVLAVAGCSGGGAGDGASGAGARAYLEEALGVAERHSVLRDTADWAAVREAAFRRAERDRARTPAQTYPAIRDALRELGDRHSQLLDPAQAAEATGAADAEPPAVELLPGRIAHVTLPAVPNERAGAEYVRRGREAVAKAAAAGTCGWVVDLRSNPGGDMFPLLGAVGAVLGDGTVGAFVTPGGGRTPWVVRSGTPGGQLRDWGPAAPLPRPGPPVAVLTSNRTASAAEAAVIAFRGRPSTRTFGEPTAGLTTGNAAHRLSDGALLLLAGSYEADRTGTVHKGPLAPDEETGEERAPQAAAQWLRAQDGCRG
ncbi:S41 family peptidase [Streptomyces sp. NPDC101132]|uniref:S41 family peptidase n=1 Tax=Streptomyces sp. NPDC101132 TaxID=3366110 RepID=UPI0037F359DA